MAKKYKILICEDEAFVARSYVRKLELEGFDVTHVTDGEAGLEVLKNNTPDLVILDLMMPRKSGFEVLQEIKDSNDKKLQAIPIIIASNLGQQSDVDETKRLGAVDFLIKSNISLKELAEKVREHLSN